MFWWPLIILGLSAQFVAWLFRIWWRNFRNRAKSQVHGNASWATEKELKAAGHFKPGGFMVGHMSRPVYASPESSLLSFGQRGSGKTLGMAASLRLESTNTLLIIDPAGQLVRDQGEELKKNGYAVSTIDLMKGEGSFSPMSFFRHSTGHGINRDLALFCSLTMEAGKSGNEVSAHFTETSRNLLAAVLKAELASGTTLARCAEILSADGPTQRRLYFQKLHAATDPIIRMGIHAFEEAGDREKGSFSTTMARKLRPWLDPAIAEVCRESTWCWEDVLTADQPHAVFVTAGIGQSEVTAPFMRMIVGLALATVERLYNRTRMPLPRGFRVYVDEADLVGNCQPIVSAVTELRKAGVNVWLNYQSMGQVTDNFPNARTLLTNCDWLLVGGMKDDKLYEEVSRMIGDKTETGTSRSTNAGRKGESEHDFARRLVKPDELRRLSPDELVALLGTLSVKAKKSWTLTPTGVRFR